MFSSVEPKSPYHLRDLANYRQFITPGPAAHIPILTVYSDEAADFSVPFGIHCLFPGTQGQPHVMFPKGTASHMAPLDKGSEFAAIILKFIASLQLS
eukprot:SAG31_NODE_5574_length_2448_cov_3.162197_2_plen_97_part_00